MTVEADSAAGGISQSFTFNTFRGEDADSQREIDVTALTAEELNAIRTSDPFMYYSILQPTRGPPRDISAALATVQASQGQTNTVQRRRRISVETDAVTALGWTFVAGSSQPQCSQAGGVSANEEDGDEDNQHFDSQSSAEGVSAEEGDGDKDNHHFDGQSSADSK